MNMQRTIQRRVAIVRVASACAWIALGACGEDQGTPPVAPESPDTVVAEIEVYPPERTIGMLGATVEFAAGAYAESGTHLYGLGEDPPRFSFSTSNPDVATVETGLVTSVSEGTAAITVTVQAVSVDVPITVRDRAQVAWTAPLDWALASVGSPMGDVAIGPDGTIYVGADQGELNRSRWFALSPQGTTLWSVDLPHTWFSTAAIGEDGTLYIGSNTVNGSVGRLIAVDPSGAVRWMREDLDEIRSAPAIGPDGIVHVAGGRRIYAVDPQGEILWVYETDDAVFDYSSPAVASNGTVYVGGDDSRLYAINPDGSLRWTFKAGDRIQSSPSIARDGTIYVGASDGELYAVNPDGSERWSVRANCGGPSGCLPIQSSPSIGADGTIYIGAEGVVAVDPGGTIRWSYKLPRSGNVLSTPALGTNGSVYVTSAGFLYALDAQGGLLWDLYTGGLIFGSPAIGIDGVIIAASFSDSSAGAWEGTVHAIVENASTNGGYAGSPWPTARGPRTNTGRAGG